MRVTLDANVLLAAVFTRGVCERVLDICWKHSAEIVVVCSEYIVDEFADNAKTKFGVPVKEVSVVVESLRHRMEFVEPLEIPLDACRDTNDLPVLGTAAAGRVDYLVTSDRDLTTLKAFNGIPIITPREFFDLVRGND